MPKQDFIDDELPFTVEEVRRALGLVLPAEEAAQLAEEIGALPAASAEMESPDGAVLTQNTISASAHWEVSDSLFAFLWCVPELSARVDEFMERRWRKWAQAWTRSSMAVRGLLIDGEPTEEVRREVQQQLGSERAQWTRQKRRVAKRIGKIQN